MSSQRRSEVPLPANLNPGQSGATLAKIMKGKYQLPTQNTPIKSQVPADQESSKPQVQNYSDKPELRKRMQEGNLFGKILHRDPSQVENNEEMDMSVVLQESNLVRKMDFPLPPESSSNEISEPSVPDPFEDTSWLAREIERLLNTKSRMTTSMFNFEVNPEAAMSNFSKLAEHDFNLEKLLNPSERCATNYGSEFKEVSHQA